MKKIKQYILTIYNKLFYAEDSSLSTWVILLLSLCTTAVVAKFLIQLYLYQDPLYLKLPANSTVFAIEYSSQPQSGEFKALSRKMGLINAQLYTNLEKDVFREIRKWDINSSDIKRKIFFGLRHNNIIEPALLYEFDNVDLSHLSQITQKSKLHTIQQGTYLVVSPSKEAISVFSKQYQQIAAKSDFQTAYKNIPKQGLVHFYINHKLISDPILTGWISTLEPFNTLLNITVGSVKENNFSLILSTYTTPRKDIVFPHTRKKFLSQYSNVIPEDQYIYFGGISISSRLFHLLKDLPVYNRNSTLVANEIYSLLNTFNLSYEALKSLTDILKSEIAITYDQDKNLTFLFDNDHDSDTLLSELNSLTAYFNPKKITYLLEDGDVATQLVPNENYKGRLLDDNTYSFKFQEQNLSILYHTPNSKRQPALITTQPKLIDSDLPSLQNNSFFNLSQNLLLPIADDALYIQPQFYADTLNSKLDTSKLPTSFTVTNYFHDGLQTVTTLQW